MKRFLFIILYLFAGYAAYGQDLIVMISGDSLNCNITEVRTEAIFSRYDAGGAQKEHLVEYDLKVQCLKYYSILDANTNFNAMSAGVKVKQTFSL